ncbi:MAG TPA: c-type cytochrome [Gaiellaceae bacterium]|nr:c-type cytochrome [Gaiellaceae bacterium]
MRARRWILALAVGAALLAGASGCGGDDEDTSATTAPTATTTGGGADGAAIFESAGCGGCHTLEAAGSSGTSGPNLDELQPDKDRVVEQVTNGGGAMPAFGDRLSEEEIEAVATYVAESAGS